VDEAENRKIADSAKKPIQVVQPETRRFIVRGKFFTVNCLHSALILVHAGLF
jgi:hypothetical protein